MNITTAHLNEDGNTERVTFSAEFDSDRCRAILTSVSFQTQASIYLRATKTTLIGEGYIVRNVSGKADKKALGMALRVGGVKIQFNQDLVNLLKEKFNVA